ncbi:hypothetical protein PSH92_20995 [Pseudomonas beijingensis]|uniref:Uncharacterized protein n=1 Tax=Pseudomonas beijingensis TaxID=2954101 RepID=A0ABY9F868_9PSED|nr:hypothetical protein [Pseudomonas sp. FP2034]WLG99818.1 hypothetical protein PSH92_20995 [Pseudomonas sp. FP2034]
MADNHPRARLLNKPIVSVLLPDSSDWDETGLLPANLANKPLKVEIPAWVSIPYDENDRCYLRVYWNNGSRPVYEKVWTPSEFGSDNKPPPADLFFDLEAQHVIHGVHGLRYEVTLFNKNLDFSEVLTVTIDEIPPDLGSDPRLIFDTTQVTSQYLDANEDKLMGDVPAYGGGAPGDVISWYWSKVSFPVTPADKVDSRTLYRGESGQPAPVEFPGRVIRDSGNGQLYAIYEVSDRAGNVSISREKSLDVNIRPPTPRKFPTVKEATNSPTGTGILNPFNGGSGVTVVVQASEVDPGDEVTVDFIGLGGEDGIGSIKGVRPISAGGLEFAIPAAVVAANIRVDAADRRTVEAYYWVGNAPQHSAIYTLTINPFAADALGQVQCRQAQVGSPATISKQQVPTEGADLEIDKWIYQARGQRMNVWAMAGGVRTDFLRGEPHGVDGTFSTKIAKDFVDRQALNSTFTLYASVSFDQGQGYIAFKSLALKVVA